MKISNGIAGYAKMLEDYSHCRAFLTGAVLVLILVKSVQYLFFRDKNSVKNVDSCESERNRMKGKVVKDAKTTYAAYHALPGPRPFPIRFIGNAFTLLTRTDVIKTAVELSQKYGECIRFVLFGEDYVLLNSPQMVQPLLASNENGHFRRGAFQEMLTPEGLRTLVPLTGDEWRTRRKMLNRSFTYRSLQQYNSSFNKYAGLLVIALEKLYSDGKAHPINELVTQCVFRISSETLMGVELSDKESEIFCKSSEIFLDTVFQRLYRPWLYPKWAWRLHPLSRKLDEMMNRMGQIAYKVINKHAENMDNKKFDSTYQDQGYDSDELESMGGSTSNNVIEVMLHHGVPPEYVFQEVATLLGIAQDATSMSILYALFMLALYPQHQTMCRNEVDAVLNDPLKYTNGNIAYHALADLKHLERCIYESQRLYPIASSTRKLETPLKINEDLVIPPGVTAVFMSHTLHLNPKYFPDPETFDPDRFLPDQVKARHPYTFLPFSAGPRNCIGKKLGLIEMKVILAKILHSFEIFTTDKRENLKLNYNGIPKPVKPFDFIFKKRNCATK